MWKQIKVYVHPKQLRQNLGNIVIENLRSVMYKPEYNMNMRFAIGYRWLEIDRVVVQDRVTPYLILRVNVELNTVQPLINEKTIAKVVDILPEGFVVCLFNTIHAFMPLKLYKYSQPITFSRTTPNSRLHQKMHQVGEHISIQILGLFNNEVICSAI